MFPRSSSPSSSSTAPTADIPPPTWLSANSNGTDGTMFPGAAGGGGGSGQQQLAISNGVLLAAVIFLFMVVVFVFLLYLYAKRYLGANPLLATHGSASSRFLFVAASPLPQRGLPASVLRSLPVTVYAGSPAPGSGSPKDKDKDGLECAVCLSEVADGEKVRTLPKCGHGFHVECIDMWFHSHDTCPLCRAPVGAAADLDTLPREEPSGASLEFPVFPTNVLFWGTHDEVTNAGLPTPPPPLATASASASSSASGRSSRKENQHQLVIDIPTRGPVALHTPPTNSPLPPSRMPGDDMRSPVSARLRSLRRLLSRGKQAVVGASSSYSPSPRGAAANDIEQGLAGAEASRPPKTPKTPPSSAN